VTVLEGPAAASSWVVLEWPQGRAMAEVILCPKTKGVRGSLGIESSQAVYAQSVLLRAQLWRHLDRYPHLSM
jgi:hypothetical protein